MKDGEVNGQPVIVSGENASLPNEKPEKGAMKGAHANGRHAWIHHVERVIMEWANAVWSKEDNSC